MKFGKSAKALAVAVAVGMSSQVMAATTNQWWSFDFEDVASITALTNDSYSAVGVWSTLEGDESSIATLTNVTETTALKLDTQGNNLTWTPNTALTGTVVLVDSDIYLVGSDSAPTGFDGDTNNPVQTAVYLKNYIDDTTNLTTNSVLCAYVSIAEDVNGWVELTGYEPGMSDTNWYSLKIEVTYPSSANPVVSFKVGGYLMSSGSETSFDIANTKRFTSSDAKKISSVSFRGTGAVDNFVGAQIVPDAAATLTFVVETYATPTNTVADSPDNVASGGDADVASGDPWYVIFNDYSVVDGVTNYLALVRVITNGTDYVDYTVSESGGVLTPSAPLYIDELSEKVRYDVNNTTNLTAGYTIKAYYGGAPSGGETPPDPTVPPAVGGATSGPATAFETINDVEYFSVTFIAPEAGIQYTLCTSATLGVPSSFTPSTDPLATAVSTAADEEITLKTPTGGATTLFFCIKGSTVTP